MSRPLDYSDSLIYLHEDAPSFLQQEISCHGHPDAAVAPVEKRHAEICFQLLYLVAQGRLCDVEPLGSTTETRLLRHRNEVS